MISINKIYRKRIVGFYFFVCLFVSVHLTMPTERKSVYESMPDELSAHLTNSLSELLNISLSVGVSILLICLS